MFRFTIVMNLIDQCMERKRDERITKEELKSQFEKVWNDFFFEKF